jgi:DNA-binding NarL/FixJ family response regulator
VGDDSGVSERNTLCVLSDDDDFVDLVEAIVGADSTFGIYDDACVEPPSVVVVDIGDGDLDGLSVVGQLHHALPATRIIAVVPVPDPITLFAALEHGADTCLGAAHVWRELLPVAREHVASRT